MFVNKGNIEPFKNKIWLSSPKSTIRVLYIIYYFD